MPIFDRWRKDKSEYIRMKTNDMRTYRKDGTSSTLGKKFGCDTLIFVSFIYL